MSSVQKSHSKKSGGKLSPPPEPLRKKEAAAPLKNIPAEFGVVRGGKVLVVHDERGQIVSTTRVSPDSPYGVGVKPGPGQVMKEYEAEDLQDALEPPDHEAHDPSHRHKPKRG